MKVLFLFLLISQMHYEGRTNVGQFPGHPLGEYQLVDIATAHAYRVSNFYKSIYVLHVTGCTDDWYNLPSDAIYVPSLKAFQKVNHK